jgi:hypothetical protein
MLSLAVPACSIGKESLPHHKEVSTLRQHGHDMMMLLTLSILHISARH